MRVRTLILLPAVLTAGCTDTDPWERDTSTDGPLPDHTVDTYWDPGYDPPADVGPDVIPEVTEPPPDTPVSGFVGDACYSASQCEGVPGSARVCLTDLLGYLSFANGYCSASCTSAADCGTGNACVDLLDYGYYCLKFCGTDTDCRTSDGYVCRAISTASGLYCLPPDGGPDY